MKQFQMLIIFFSIAFVTISSGNVFGEQQNSVIKDIEDIISRGESASYKQYETIKNKIEENAESILPQLLLKAKTPQLPEATLAIYIWAIGLTKSPNAIEDIIKLSSGKKSKVVVSNAYRALASIGGESVGEYLFKKLDTTSDQMMRYTLFDLLAQIQFRPALPKTIEILKLDPSKYYWQTIFVFGKYGDFAVPFLLEKIADKDRNIRTNSIMALGLWLIPTESLEPLRNQFWQEKDPQVRGLILSSLEKVNTSINDILAFSRTVVQRETDEDIIRFANETISNFDKMASHVENFRSQKKQDRAAFEAEYNKILNSFGKEGDYEKLSSSSTKDDEPKLKKLKEVILRRNSDECFYDYEKVNNIILLNRMI